MLKTILVSSILLCSLASISQVDYKEFKKRFPLTCTKWDSASVIEAQHLMDSLDQFEIVNGEDQFLYNIGMTYYMRYAKWKSVVDLKKSIGYNQEGYDKFQGSGFAWQLAFLYERDGNCEEALKYAGIYAELSKEEGLEINYKQLYYIYRDCCN